MTRDIYGHKGTSYKEELKNLIKELGIEDSVHIGGKLDPEDVSSYLDITEFGVVSYLLNPLTDVAVPNKVFEYLALNKPVIACRLRALQSLFGDNGVLYYEPEDPHDLAKTILRLHKNMGKMDDMMSNAHNVYENCKWDVMKQRLYKMYEDLDGQDN
jgi:glycosyltransferase involved in cell wall biosynthesis